MQKLQYSRTWCDYITPCPYHNEVWSPEYKCEVMMGDYECSQCKHNAGLEEEKYNWSSLAHSFDGSNYTHITNNNICKCNYEKN